MDHRLFAYGTLLDPHVQRAVFGRTIEGAPDRLHGFRKTLLQDCGDSFPNLVADPQGHVDGRLLEISSEDLRRADLYEGDLYVRHKVTLASGNSAWVYYG